jgi:hypothetical protein
MSDADYIARYAASKNDAARLAYKLAFEAGAAAMREAAAKALRDKGQMWRDIGLHTCIEAVDVMVDLVEAIPLPTPDDSAERGIK